MIAVIAKYISTGHGYHTCQRVIVADTWRDAATEAHERAAVYEELESLAQIEGAVFVRPLDYVPGAQPGTGSCAAGG